MVRGDLLLVDGAELVELLPLPVVRENGIRLLDLAEALLGVGLAGVDVGMEPPRESAVRLLDLVGRRRASDAEYLIQVPHCSSGRSRPSQNMSVFV